MKQFSMMSLFLVHLIITPSITADWTVEDLVNAYNLSSNKILFDPDGYLNDIALDQKTQELVMSLQNQKAFITRIVLIGGMSNNYKRFFDTKDIEKFVDELSFQLLLNKQNEMNSLFIVFSINDRLMRIRTGENVRAILPDSKALDNLKSIKSYLQNKQYSYAVNYLVQKIFDRINSSYTWIWDILEFFEPIAPMVIGIFIWWLLRDKDTTVSAPVASRLTKIQKICEQNKPKKEIITTTCVICLEDFKESDNDQQIVLEVDPLKQSLQGHDDMSVVKIECGHSFHSGCITKWTSDHNTCPTCREKIDGEEDRKELSQQLVAVQSSMFPEIVRLRFKHGSRFTWNTSDHTGVRSGGGRWNARSGGATSGW
jgi:hypothetical protein